MKFIWKGYGEIITAAVLWGTAGTLVRMISDMTALNIIFFRVTLAFIILLFIFSLSGSLNKLRLKDKKRYLLLFSLLQITTMLTFFISIMEASVAIAVLLLYTAPLYVTAFSPLLLKERSTGKGWMALALSIAGVILIIDPLKIDISLKLTGIIAGMLSGVSYGFQILISKHISKSYSGYSQAFWSFMIAMLLLLPFAAVSLDIVSGNIGYLILLAIFPTILAISLYFNGLNKVRAASASILGLIEPVSAVIFSLLILHESIPIPVMLGGALILMGGAIVTREP